MFYADSIHAAAEIARKKAAYLRQHPLAYLISSMLAGAYVGVGVFLVFSIGGPLAAANSPWLKTLMGASFAVALSLVVFAGAELFTGNNMVMVIGWRQRTNTCWQMIAIWAVSWFGNLLGCLLLAGLLYYAGTMNQQAPYDLVQEFTAKKMHLGIPELLARGILCNWLVCLAVWCTYRMKSEAGKLIMIFWCLYAFVAAGFEHSVANMTLFSLALFQKHAAEVSWLGMGHNLLWVTLGNIIGGAVFVAGAYLIAGAGGQSLAQSSAIPSAAPDPHEIVKVK